MILQSGRCGLEFSFIKIQLILEATETGLTIASASRVVSLNIICHRPVGGGGGGVTAFPSFATNAHAQVNQRLNILCGDVTQKKTR